MKLYEEAFYFIAGHGRGWAFSARDLMKKYSRQQADSILSFLLKKKKIRRVCRGIYDYPKYSEYLKQNLSPDIDQVARALARKFNWRIEISGNSALNLLGLSTQVEARYIYFSDGPGKEYDIQGIRLTFKSSSLKNIGFKHKESSIIVQALKELGKDRINSNVISKIRDQIQPDKFSKILNDTSTATSWIYEVIKQICREN